MFRDIDEGTAKLVPVVRDDLLLFSCEQLQTQQPRTWPSRIGGLSFPGISQNDVCGYFNGSRCSTSVRWTAKAIHALKSQFRPHHTHFLEIQANHLVIS